MYFIIYKFGPFRYYLGDDGFLTRYMEKVVRYPSHEEAMAMAQTRALQSPENDVWFVISEDEALVEEIMER